MATSGDGDTMSFADARAARAAIAAAGSHADLDTGLRRAAEVLRGRFGADHASYMVHRSEHEPRAVAVDTVGMDEPWLRRWVAQPDRQFRAQVAADAMPLIMDLREIARSPSQEESLAFGVRSCMHLALRDEQAEMLGLVTVASRRPGAFIAEQLEEFRELAALSASFVRRALLQEQMLLERELLLAEAALLSTLARPETDGRIPQPIADGIREAIGADLVVIFSHAFDTAGLAPVYSFSPGDALTSDDCVSLQAAVAENGSQGLGLATGDCYVNHDLRGSAPSPMEALVRDALRQGSLLIASGRVTETRSFAIAATRRDAGAWNSSTVAFLSRAAGVLDLSIGRERTRALTTQESARQGARARLLTTLDPTRPIKEIAHTFAEEIRTRYGVDCIAILQWSHALAEDPVVYLDSRILPIPAGGAVPPPGFYEVVKSGRPEYLNLGESRPSKVEELLFASGVRHVGRIPLGVQGDVSGFVTFAWEDDADPAERLEELEHAVRPLALVIERASLLADIERQRQTFEVAADILASLATTGETVEACTLIAERLRVFFEADHVALGTVDFAAGTRNVLGFTSAVMARAELPVALGAGDSEAYATALHGDPEVFGDLQQESLNEGTDIARQAGLRSLMRAPIALSSDMGLVSVASLKPWKYREEDGARLLNLCRPVGLAIDRMRLIADMAATSEMLAAQARVLASFGPGATIESAGEVFVSEARRLFGATHALVATLSPGPANIAALSSDHLSAAELRFAHPDDPENARFLDQLLSGEPQLVPDLGVERHGEIEERAYERGLRSLMRAPIRSSDGTVRGIITVGSTALHAWGERELGVLVELTAALGLVAERAKLFDEAAERTTAVGTLTRLLSTFNVSAPPAEVAQLFAGEVRRFLGADAAMVMAFDHETGTRELVAFSGDPKRRPIARRTPLSDSGTYQGMMGDTGSLFDARQPEQASAWLRVAATDLGLGSVIAVRLDVEGTPVGMIAAGSAEPGSLGPLDLHILTEVAAPLAMLLERARIVTSLQQQTQRTQAVLDVLAALGPQDTLEEVAQPVAEAIRAMYGTDHCAITVLNDGQLTVAGIDSAVAPDWSAQRAASAAGVFAYVAAHGFHIDGSPDDAAVTASATTEFLRTRGIQSILRVRIGSEAVPHGLVTVGSTTPRAFTEADARQLAQIVQPLSVIVNYFRGRREAAQRTLRLEYTNRILTRLSAGGTAEHLAAGFLAECRVLFDCEHAAAVHFDHERDLARLLALDSTIIDAATLPPSLSLGALNSGRLIQQPTPHVIADTREESETGGFHAELNAAGFHSSIRAPLIVQDTVHGVVSLWTRGESAFTDEDAELLGTLTRPFAIALEKAAALESLGESELKYRSLVAQAEEMIFQFDGETRTILDANAYTGRTLGYSPREMLTLRLDDIIDATAEDITTDVATTLENGELHLVDKRYRRRDGSLIDVDMVASLVSYGGRQAVLVLARDVSERKAFQRQLVQGQKMESLGTMAGHVAHDFNNLLTTILGFAGLLKRSTSMDAEERENLGLIEDAARRAADLTGHLLSFARGGLVRFGPVDLRTVVNDTMRLAEPSLNDSLHASTRLPATPIIVEGDAGQLQQALFNIVSNARDAMPEGGTIDVDLRTDGVTAVLTIADNGPGMDEETKTRIFEPFYTTKPIGTGTGLGMAITYGIIQGHHGDVALDTARGKGTTFTITLPLLPGGTSTATVDAFNAGEGNLVLVVDDDEMVRRTTSATLAELGYNVVEAPGGATAVEIVRARPERFSVVLLDLVMPGMTGSETFRALTAIRPDLPVVVCTGYAADAHIDTDVKRRIAGLVQKPFSGERLGKALLAAGALPTRRPAPR